MKINLGCRNNIMKGYINMDIEELLFEIGSDPRRNMLEIDETEFLHGDAMNIDKYFRTGSVSEVIANHFFEHLTHEQVTILLYKIWCILEPGGLLKITTPDFYGLIKKYKRLHESKDFSDVDILHIKVFDTKEETYHKTVWYEDIGKYYLEREHFFEVTEIRHPSDIEVSFIAQKL
jgi:predicted SAM-dependent methyltransferase